MDTKTHTRGTSQLEIRSRLFFKKYGGLYFLLSCNFIYCGDLDSIDHTFSECQFTKSFTEEVLQWFNTENNSKFNPNTEDFLFGISQVQVLC